MTYNIKLLQSFIDKYRSICTIEIVLIEKSIGNNIYQINLSNDKYQQINNKLSNISALTNKIQRYYHTDKYIEIIDNEIKYKKEIIIDKLELNNILIIAKQIELLHSDSIPGLNKYDYETYYTNSIFEINGVQINLKDIINNENKINHNCTLTIQDAPINTIHSVLTTYLL